MFKILLVLILALRIIFFSLPSFQIDMNDWKAWSTRLAEVGPSNFYSPNYFSDYFPGYLYILWVLGVLFNFLKVSISSLNFELVIKAITTVFDTLTALYIYKIISRHRKTWAKVSFILYLFNPAVIFNSSVWGQIDGIFTFFLVFSSYYLIEKEDILKSNFLTALGIIIKPNSLALLPLFLITYFRNFSTQKTFKNIGLLLLFLVLLSVPFFPKDPILGIFRQGLRSQNVYEYTSLFAFNFWALFDWWKSDNTTFILSLKIWGIILYFISLIFIAVPALRKKIDSKIYYLMSSLSLFAFFLLLTRIHERYLFPFLAFILIASILRKSKTLFIVYALSSILHFINLWYVYYYYNNVYQNTILSKNAFFEFVNNNYKIFSLSMVILFGILIIYYYKFYAKKISS